MKASLWLRPDILFRQASPVLLTVLLVLASIVPLRMPGLATVTPMLPLVAVYYWSLYRPDLMPLAAVFAIGLLHDTLSGAPIGLFTAVFVIVRGLVETQRRFFYGKPFVIVWLGFALVAVGAFVFSWLLASAFYATVIDGRAIWFQAALTIGMFPLLSWLLGRWQQVILRQE